MEAGKQVSAARSENSTHVLPTADPDVMVATQLGEDKLLPG